MTEPTDADLIAYGFFKGLFRESPFSRWARSFEVHCPDYVGLLQCNSTGTINLPPEIRQAIIERMSKEPKA